MSPEEVERISGDPTTRNQLPSLKSRRLHSDFACFRPAGYLRITACLCAIVCGFLLVTVTASASTDEETDNKLKFYFSMSMMQLIMQAGACSRQTTDDAATIRRILEKYMEQKWGTVPRTAFDKGIADIREKLGKLSDAEQQYACTEALRESTRNYEMIRELYVHRKLDGGSAPPTIDPGLAEPQ